MFYYDDEDVIHPIRKEKGRNTSKRQMRDLTMQVRSFDDEDIDYDNYLV